LEKEVDVGISAEIVGASPLAGNFARQVRDPGSGPLPLIVYRSMYFFGFAGMAGHAGLGAVVSRQGLVSLGRREHPITRDHHPSAQEHCANRKTFGRIVCPEHHSLPPKKMMEFRTIQSFLGVLIW
jgi:hypothetical protein